MSDRGYTNPELLVTPEALHGRLNDPALRIVDTRAVYEYVAGHIPGAIHLNFYGISLNNTSPEALDAFMWTLSSLMADRGIGSQVYRQRRHQPHRGDRRRRHDDGRAGRNGGRADGRERHHVRHRDQAQIHERRKDGMLHQ